MDITFSLQNGQYIAEFKVTSEFNLHIEKGVGTMQMLQRTSGTFFDKVEDFKMEKGDVVYDFDSGSFLGEKTIRLVSSVEPRFCFITTSGEVTEIKSQSKEVEVTSNGTMDITPDAGFAYLSAVKVKTNVPTSGEGGGMEYIDTSSKEFMPLVEMGVLSQVVKLRNDDGTIIIASPCQVLINNGAIDDTLLMKIIAVGISPSERIIGGVFGKEGITLTEFGGELMAKAPRLTESEFYNLNA